MLAAIIDRFHREENIDQLLYSPQSRELDLSSVRSVSGLTLLHRACIDNDIRMADHLLQFHPELLNLGDLDDRSPLFYAVHNVELVRLLLRHNANVNKLTKYGQSIYSLCCSTIDVLALILPRLNDIDGRDGDGRTKLHYAVEGHHINQVRLLLRHRANPNIVDRMGFTPMLLWSAFHFTTPKPPDRIGRLLYDRGADVWANNLVKGHWCTEIFRHYDRLKILLAANIFGPLYDYRIVRTIGTYLC